MPQIITLPGARDGADTVFSMQALAVGEVRQVAAGSRIYSSLQTLYWADHNYASVINAGRIWNISPSNIGGAISGFYVPEVRNSGLIVSEAPSGNAYGISVGTGGSLVDNSGQIFAIGNGVAQGVVHWDRNVWVENSGLIAAYAPTGTAGGVGDAVGVAMFNGGHLENRAGAAILAEGLFAKAVIFSRGGEIRNAGRIEAHAIDPNNDSVAILTGALTATTIRVENSGIIRAEIAYRSDSEYGFSPPQQPSDEIYNLAGGEIYGLIDTRLGPDSLINRGLVRGDVRMGEGDDLVDTVGGILDGIADLGGGDDRFFGGAADEEVLGGRGADWLDGGGGNDLLLGGLGDDTVAGGAGNDGIYGEYGDDRIILAGGDRADAGPGDDVITAGDLSFAALDGGGGVDRLVLATGAIGLDLAAVRASGRVKDIEEIETRGQQRLVVRAGDAAGLSGENALRFLTTATDAIELIGAWAEAAGVSVGGTAFRRFDLGGESVYVAGPGSIVVATSPSAPANGLDAIAAGPAAPLVGSVPGVELSGVTTIRSYFNPQDTVTVESYEIWRSTGGDPLFAPQIIEHSIVNYGLMESSGPGNGGAKVVMAWNVARIDNHGTMRATAGGTDHAHVIYTVGWAALTNGGLIEAVVEAGYATGAALGGSWYDDMILINRGTISAVSNASGRAFGVVLMNDVAGLNDGTISALGGDGSMAVRISGLRQFTNTGDVTADLAAGASGTTTGIEFIASPWGSTLINDGLIRGAIAIDSRLGRGLTVQNLDRIEGAVKLDDGDNRFENKGRVTGAIDLGQGNDDYDGAQGIVIGGVSGGMGNDRLRGGGASDSLAGGRGIDSLSGGGGADVFVFTDLRDSHGYQHRSDGKKYVPDVITDFRSGEDRIDLSAIDAVWGTPANETFTFIGSAAFSNSPGELRFEGARGSIHLFADVNGDGVADLHIIVMTDSLAAADLIL
ncbi:MAG TPA: M10 family metallopeptidase C-terminal domain-containing protein [Allosphingosinicella sp.]|nr:M10 family metallopeptidase C-terminal domain-containing protein [Allosphingosinicella sp.]